MCTYFRQELATALRLPELAEEETKAMGGLDWYRTQGPLAVEQDALPTALPSPAKSKQAADSAVLKDRYDHW